MEPSRNDITGDIIATKVTSDSYRKGWETIFGKNKLNEQGQVTESKQTINEERKENE